MSYHRFHAFLPLAMRQKELGPVKEVTRPQKLAKAKALFDKEKFASHLRAKGMIPPPYGEGKCAKYVRQAIVAAGLNTAGNPISAKDYGPFLLKLGFKEVPAATLSPQKGDIVVIPPNPSSSKHGHIAGFDGEHWISDFVQRDLFGGPSYRKAGKFKAYRYPH